MHFITSLCKTWQARQHLLYRLLKKEEPWRWMKQEQVAFAGLKHCLVKLPELAYPNSSLPYDLHSDASDFGLSARACAVLVQQGRPIAYASRTLNSAERNYSTTEKECLTVVWSLEQFHLYVHGASFTVYTDHGALRSILTSKTPRGRIARWIMTIQAYSFTVQHEKEALNSDADGLSSPKKPKTRTHDTTLCR